MDCVDRVAARRTVFSPCRTWRYAHSRNFGGRLDDGSYVLFIGLNQSTVDEQQDDPTIRTCVSFARAWGMSALCMANLFACCATDPSDMLAAGDPVGPETTRTSPGSPVTRHLLSPHGAIWAVTSGATGRCVRASPISTA